MAGDSGNASQRGLAPFLTVSDASAAIGFYASAFGAEELLRLTAPGGKIVYAELSIEGSTVMLSDEHPEMGAVSPTTLGGSPVKLHLKVADADAAASQALAAGATLVRPVELQFHGNRGGMVMDPFGHSWFLSSPVEALAPDEIKRRFHQMFASV